MQEPPPDKNVDRRVCDYLMLPYERDWKFESVASGAAGLLAWLGKRIIDSPSGSVVPRHNQVELRLRASKLAVACIERWEDLQGDERDGAKLLIECLGGSLRDLLTMQRERRANNQEFDWQAAQIVFLQPSPTIFPMLRKALSLLSHARAVDSHEERITKDEANIQVREELRKNPNATIRQLAEAVGCSTGLVNKTPAWKAVTEARKADRRPGSPRVVSLTDQLQAVIPSGEDELERLVHEQDADAASDQQPRRRTL